MDRRSLEKIPLIDIGSGGRVALLDAARARADALVVIARRRYGRLALRCGDAISRAWLSRSVTPYRAEVEQLAARIGAAGGVMLNLSFEWGCTGLVENDASGGVRMLRVLDWRLPDLGQHVVVARVDAPAGSYYDVTWPGSGGVLTAMAPGRFSAAIHQAPMRRHGLGKIGDWAVNRRLVWARTALAPSHLLRQVFETASDFATARDQLASTPLALPAIFLLAGAAPGEACVIERIEDRATVHDGAGTCGNSWRFAEAFGETWSARGYRNDQRLVCLSAMAGRPAPGFDWVISPVLNRDTRLAVMANAASGELAVQGFEEMAPITQEFRLPAKDLVAA
jgi:hypothetical protein